MAKWLTHRFAKPTRAGSTPALDSFYKNSHMGDFVRWVQGAVCLHTLSRESKSFWGILVRRTNIAKRSTELVEFDSRPGLKYLNKYPCGTYLNTCGGSRKGCRYFSERKYHTTWTALVRRDSCPEHNILCRDDGIGRHAALKLLWGNSCGFKSRSRHMIQTPSGVFILCWERVQGFLKKTRCTTWNHCLWFWSMKNRDNGYWTCNVQVPLPAPK